MMRLSGMRFDSTEGVHDNIMEMRDIATQLKSLKVKIFDSFLVHFILNSLSIKYALSRFSIRAWLFQDFL